VNRDIHVSREKSSLNFRREHAFSTSVEVHNFGAIAACDDHFGLDRDVRMRASNCLLNQQSLGARKLAAPRAQSDLRNHRGNVTRDTLQGKLRAFLQFGSAKRIFSEGWMFGRVR